MKYGPFLFSIFILTITIPIKELKSQSLEDGLLIYYSWDSTFLDQSGNEYDPEYYRAQFTENRIGREKSALIFNGENDVIKLRNLNVLKPNFPMAMAMWIYMEDLTPENNVFFTNDFSENAHCGVWMNLSSQQQISISFGDGYGFGPYNRRTKLSNTTLEANEWYYITGVAHSVYDLRVFINGIEDIGYIDGSGNYMYYSGEGGNIGRKDANYQLPPYYYKGKLDEFRYWARGLSNEEVYELYLREMEIVSNNEHNNPVELSIYPNPTKDWIKLRPGFHGEYSVYLIDQFGRFTYSEPDVDELNLSDLPKGIYILQIQTSDGKLFSEKIIKQ